MPCGRRALSTIPHVAVQPGRARGCEAPAADPPIDVAGVLRTHRCASSRVEPESVLPHDRQVPGRPTGGSAPQIGEVVAEIAAAIAYLETLSVRLHVGEQPGEPSAAALPPSTLLALRRSCQRVAWHSDRALAAISPSRAAAARAAATQLREVELLRFAGRTR